MAFHFSVRCRKIVCIASMMVVCVQGNGPHARTTTLWSAALVEKQVSNVAMQTSISHLNSIAFLAMPREQLKRPLFKLAEQTLDEDRVRNIRMRRGGELIKYINEASRMIASGRSYRVIEDQYSAAAMQVLFVESQVPDRICAGPNAKLHFHLSMNVITHKPDKEPDWAFIAFIRPENLKRLGKLPPYGKGFKTVKASDFLGICKP